jgi:sec-independent protein translocase protein TatA
MGRIGGTELILIVLLALLLFGAGRLADIGRGLGEGIKNFKKGIKDESDADEAKRLDVKPGESGNKAAPPGQLNLPSNGAAHVQGVDAHRQDRNEQHGNADDQDRSRPMDV